MWERPSPLSPRPSTEGYLLEDDGHVVEVGEVRLEEGLAHPVLTRVQDVIDADLGPIPCGPGAQLDPGESGLDPDLHRMARRQLTVNPAGRKALATNRVG